MRERVKVAKSLLRAEGGRSGLELEFRVLERRRLGAYGHL